MRLPVLAATFLLLPPLLLCGCDLSGSGTPAFLLLGLDDGGGTQPHVVQGGVATLLATANPAGHSWPQRFTANRGRVYFTAFDGTTNTLWVTDATAAGTRRLAPVYPSDMAGFGKKLFFAGNDGGDYELWSTEGTPESTAPFLDLNPEGSSCPHNFTVAGGVLYFSAYHPAYGEEVWASDGTPEGTTMVGDLRPGPESSNPSDFTTFGPRLFFSALAGQGGEQFWVADPAGGARPVADFGMGEGWAEPSHPTALGADLFFAASDGVSGEELWATNGTAAGTRQVMDIAPGAEGSAPEHLTVMGGLLYFTVSGGPSPGLMAANGGRAWPVGPPALMGEVASEGSSLLFGAEDGAGDRGLWLFEPYGAEPDVLRRLAGPFTGLPVPARAVTKRTWNKQVYVSPGVGEHYFFAEDAAHGRELWVSDGTAGGTRLLFDFLPGPASGVKFD